MTKLSSLVPASKHSKNVHADAHHTRRSFLPKHEHSFRGDTRDENGRSTKVSMTRKDFPETGTPDAVLHRDETALKNECSEQVIGTGQVVLESDALIEPAENDWLNNRDAP